MPELGTHGSAGGLRQPLGRPGGEAGEPMTEVEWLTSRDPIRLLAYLEVDPDSPDALEASQRRYRKLHA